MTLYLVKAQLTSNSQFCQHNLSLPYIVNVLPLPKVVNDRGPETSDCQLYRSDVRTSLTISKYRAVVTFQNHLNAGFTYPLQDIKCHLVIFIRMSW